MKRAFVLFFLSLTPASWAQSPDTAPQRIPPPPPPVGSPISVGEPHVCLKDYPADAVAAHAEGTTVVGFTITETGTTTDAHVTRSSGTASLDDAALMCPSRWLYRPAMKEGKPVAVPWKAEVRWMLHGTGTPPMVVAPRPLTAHNCPKSRSIKLSADAVTFLRLHITTEGKVSDTTVQQSSGNPDLDQAANKCALTWTFEPANVNGRTAEIYLIERFNWSAKP